MTRDPSRRRTGWPGQSEIQHSNWGEAHRLKNLCRTSAWGDLRYDGNPGDGPNTQYCANLGHKKDNESGLTYMRARYYEPWTGRFINEDPARDGLNWYGYCRGDPVNSVDPEGESLLDDAWVAFGLWLMWKGADLVKSGLATAISGYVALRAAQGMKPIFGGYLEWEAGKIIRDGAKQLFLGAAMFWGGQLLYSIGAEGSVFAKAIWEFISQFLEIKDRIRR